VDLYIGGSEHATGHLLYSRFWVKFMHDRGLVPVDEPFKKLINQGMILGESAYIPRFLVTFYETIILEDKSTATSTDSTFQEYIYITKSIIDKYRISRNINVFGSKIEEFLNAEVLKRELSEFVEKCNFEIGFLPTQVDVGFVNNSNELDIEAFKNWREEYKNAEFITEEDGTFKVSREVEKMSKSKYNVVNPDDICSQYGADTLRMYEMFLGPLEQAKPWNTAGITGVHGFLKKLWKLYHSPFEGDKGDVSQSQEANEFYVSEDSASKDSLKTLHKTIKKVQEDIENFSFNTSVSSFMIAVNELSAQKCNSREVLEPLAILISPYAPHIAEELWEKLGHSESISTAPFPKFEEQYLLERTKEYPISFNGKMRFTLELPLDISKEEIESAVMAHEKTAQYLEGRTPKKVIIVPGKIVNIVG
jgi:leucyl-tRNA synthetase